MASRQPDTYSMQAASDWLRSREIEARFEANPVAEQLGQIACGSRGLNFLVNFIGENQQMQSVGFVAIYDNVDRKSADEVNVFNGKIRAAKLVSHDNHLALMHDFVVPKSGLVEELFVTNFGFWEFALHRFGAWYLKEES